MRKFLILGATVAALGLLAAAEAPADAAVRNAAGVANAQTIQMDLSARRYYRRHYYRHYYRPYYRHYYRPYYYRPYRYYRPYYYPYSYYYGPRYYYPYGYYYRRPGIYFGFGW